MSATTDTTTTQPAEPPSYSMCVGGFVPGPLISGVLALQTALMEVDQEEAANAMLGFQVVRDSSEAVAKADIKQGKLQRDTSIIAGSTRAAGGAVKIGMGVKGMSEKPPEIGEKMNELNNIEGYQKATNDRLAKFKSDASLTDFERTDENSGISQRVGELKTADVSKTSVTKPNVEDSLKREGKWSTRTLKSADFTDEDAIQSTAKPEAEELKKNFDQRAQDKQRQIDDLQQAQGRKQMRNQMFADAGAQMLEGAGQIANGPLQAKEGVQKKNADLSQSSLQEAGKAISTAQSRANSAEQSALQLNSELESIQRSKMSS